jgi:hypothetical protein
MFLFNGVSFIFSAFLNMFLKIPEIERKEKQHFFADMKDGYKFVWRFRGLRDLLAIISVLNFVSTVAIILFLPLFQQTESLGPGRYGIAMAFEPVCIIPIMEFAPINRDFGTMSGMVEPTAGEKKAPHTLSIIPAAKTIQIPLDPLKTAIASKTTAAPLIISVNINSFLLSTLSAMTPAIGETSTAGNVDVAIMVPIKAVEPVTARTQKPRAIPYMTSPNIETS